MSTTVLFPADDHGDDDRFPEVPGYEIVEEIGRGGMAIVYRARQLSLNRIVAIRTQHAGLDENLRLLQKEAEILVRLRHPNVLAIFDLVKHNGRDYLIVELTGEGTLPDRINKSPQPPLHAAALLKCLAQTVGFIHQQGIVHCNLKPRKILCQAVDNSTLPTRVTPFPYQELYGHPIISGFELAVSLTEVAKNTDGTIRGTPAYMAPEQARGDWNSYSPAIDVHALGVILYELLTGTTPFASNQLVEIMKNVMESEPSPLQKHVSGIPKELEQICRKCLQKDPKDRYANGMELAQALATFLAKM